MQSFTLSQMGPTLAVEDTAHGKAHKPQAQDPTEKSPATSRSGTRKAHRAQQPRITRFHPSLCARDRRLRNLVLLRAALGLWQARRLALPDRVGVTTRSEEHTSELQ